MGWYSDTPSYAAGTDYQLSGNNQDENNDGFLFFTWSVGGRYFFAKQDISPYVGGGLAFVAASYDPRVPKESRDDDFDFWEDDYFVDYDSESEEDTDTGLGIYGVVGIEMLRLTQSRLNLELRVDRPFFSLDSQDMMPITIGFHPLLIILMCYYFNPGNTSGCCACKFFRVCRKGSVHDYRILEESRLAISPDTEKLADSGYQGIATRYANSSTPIKE